MIEFFLCSICFIAYFAVASLIFGYLTILTNDRHKGWETPIPIFGGVFWPITLIFLGLQNIAIPMQYIGETIAKKSLEKIRKQNAVKEKIRIELQEAEREVRIAEQNLERELAELEYSVAQQLESKETMKKRPGRTKKAKIIHVPKVQK